MSEILTKTTEETFEFPEMAFEEPTNSWWVKLNEDNRICMLTSTQQEDGQFYFDFPQDFDIGSHNNYKIVDNELVYDEMVYPEIEVQPSENEQMRADIDYIAVMTGIEL